MSSDIARATVFVSGSVQGVGFRWWTRARALELGLTGYARNSADGRDQESDGRLGGRHGPGGAVLRQLRRPGRRRPPCGPR